MTAIHSIARGVAMVVADKKDQSPEIRACVTKVTVAFFASNNIEGMAKAIASLFEGYSVWKRSSLAIADFIAEKYSSEVMVSGFVEMVNSLAPGILLKGKQEGT
jgi:hypothetical protein